MSDREILAAALLMAAACVVAWAPPLALVVMAVMVLAWTLATRHRLTAGWAAAAIAALVIMTSSLAARAEAGLSARLPSRVTVERASVATDPVRLPFGISAELRIRGLRVSALFPRESSPVLEHLLVGDEVLITGRIRSAQGRWEYRAAHHLSGDLSVERVTLLGGGPWWWRAANAVRRCVDRGVAGFGEEDRAMFLGVVFGDDRDQGEWLGHLFKAAGISHLTAVSGQNVAFVLVAASPLLMALSLRWRWWATLAILGFFTLVTRAEPSVLRAVAMAGAVATAAVMGRSVSRWRGIAIAVMVLLVLDPLLVWSTGFRLSLAATLGIVGLSRPIADRLPGPSWLREPASVMLSAQVATAPVLVTFVAGIPLAAVGTNLVAVPIAGALMVWGVVTAPIAGLLGGGAAWMLGVPSRFMVRSLIVIARIGAKPRWGFLNPTTAVLMSAGIAVWCLVPRQWSKRVLAGTGVVVLVWAALSWWTAAAMISAPSAELVTGSTGRALVIHPRARVRDVLTVVQQCACSRIDLLIVEHASRSSGEVVWRVRGLLEVGVVATDGPAVIRDAVALREGVIDLGGVRLAVTDEDTGWKVASVSSG